MLTAVFHPVDEALSRAILVKPVSVVVELSFSSVARCTLGDWDLSWHQPQTLNTKPLQFLTRPFVVGDRITLKTAGGGVIIAGVVEGISPMRTVIRTDDNVPEVSNGSTAVLGCSLHGHALHAGPSLSAFWR